MHSLKFYGHIGTFLENSHAHKHYAYKKHELAFLENVHFPDLCTDILRSH